MCGFLPILWLSLGSKKNAKIFDETTSRSGNPARSERICYNSYMQKNVRLSKCDPTLSGREYRPEQPIYAQELRILVNLYAQKLERKGVASPLNDVLELMAWFLETPREALQAQIAQKTPIKEVFAAEGAAGYAGGVSQMDFLIDERAKRVPLQHITGEAHFYGLELKVGKGVFVPRPETETLVEKSVAFLRKSRVGVSEPAALHILDLCAGSGAIALALGAHIENANILAVEKSAQTFPFLKQNLQAHRNSFARGTQVKALLADATRFGGEPGVKYRLITCNPPYVPLAQKSSLPPEVRKDPASALFGDDASSAHGFALPAQIIAQAVPLLEPGGMMIVEHTEEQSSLARAAFERASAESREENRVEFSAITHLDDLTGRPRFTMGFTAATHAK